jgi:O-succinylbenzoate synthase
VNIVAADWLDYVLPLRHAWQTSRGEMHERSGRLLRLRDVEGKEGWGDAAPLPEFGIDGAAAQAHAEECARLDLAAQLAGLPLNAWLSGTAPVAAIAVNANLGTLTANSAQAAQKALAAGFTVLKLKVGIADVDEEITLLQQLARRLPSSARLRLDANGAWSLAAARDFIVACAGLPVESLEEPLATPDLVAWGALQERAGFPIAIDESIGLLTGLPAGSIPVRRLILKPARHGGLLECVALARRVTGIGIGIDCVVTSGLESRCGLLAAAHLAATVAPQGTHGLAVGEWFAENTGPGPAIRAGYLEMPAAAGIGFRPFEGLTARPCPD